MNVFTYGSLMFPDVWRHVVRGDYRSAGATLHGYVRRRVQGVSYPGIVAHPSETVPGRLYFDVSAEDVAALDRFEGAEYARSSVCAVLEDGARMEAQTYVYLHPGKLGDTPWEAQHFDVARFLQWES